jgi:uncharacterized protein (TIGR00645 family)
MLQKLMLASRWLMAPFYVFLVIGLMVLVYVAGLHLWHIVMHVSESNESQITVQLLQLVDLSLLASLIVIVVVSGFENYLTPIAKDENSKWPIWMSQIDFAALKLKLIASITAIGSIQLLETFINIETSKDRDIMWSIAVLLTFVFTGLVLALTDYFNGGEKH